MASQFDNCTFDYLNDPVVLHYVDLMTKQNNLTGLAAFYNKAAGRLHCGGLFLKAIPFYEASIQVLLDNPEVSSQYSLSSAYSLLANCYCKIGNLEQSDASWEKCFDHIESSKQDHLYIIFLQFALYCNMRGWNKYAIDIQRAILELEPIDEECKRSSHVQLSHSFFELGDFENMLKHTCLALDKISKSEKDLEVHYLVYKCFAELGLHKVKKAKKTLKFATQFRDIIDDVHDLRLLDLATQLCKEANKMTKCTLRKKVLNIIKKPDCKPCKVPKWVRRMASFIKKQKHFAHCGNKDPRTILMICKGCEKARYCNDDCYKSHWKKHKKDCKK